MFPYESDQYRTEEYPRISKGINETDNVVKTNQLAIRYISENINGKNKVIVQIDKKHNRIEDKYFDFVINIDKRQFIN